MVPSKMEKEGLTKILGSLSRYIKPDIQTIAIGQAGAETQDVGTSLKEVYGWTSTVAPSLNLVTCQWGHEVLHLLG